MNSRKELLTGGSEGDDEAEGDEDTGEIGSNDDSGGGDQDEEVTTEEGEADTVLETAADLANEMYG